MLICLCVSFTVGFIFSVFVAYFFVNKILNYKIISVFDGLKWEKELEPHVEHLMNALKNQIPIAGMFLTETIKGRFKLTAKKELELMIPEIKINLIKKIEKVLFTSSFYLFCGLIGSLFSVVSCLFSYFYITNLK